MKKNDPKTRLEDLELEINDLVSNELFSSLQKELAFRKAIENSIPSGIAVMDDKGKQVYVNQAFCRMVGWEEDDLLGKLAPYLYWPEEEIPTIEDAMRKTLSNNVPKEGFDLVFCHKSGKLFPVNVIISPFVQQDKKIYWLANVIDITERKKSEEALKKSQLLLMSSIESQKETIMFSLDKDYLYLYFNKAHAEAMKFAYNVDIEIGEDFLNCISKEDDRILLKKNLEIALKGESISLIQSFGAAHIDYYEVFFNPIANEKGEIVGCSSLARNISERQRTEKALSDSEVKFKEIINQINDVIIVFDEQGKIIIWNKGAERVIGLKAEDTLSRSIVDIQYQLTPPSVRHRTLIENGIKGIITQKTPEIFKRIIDSEIITLNSGKIINIESTVFPIKLDGYNLFCTIIRDNTEIKRYEKELLRISADKDKFYSLIAQYLYDPFNLFHNYTKTMVSELDTLSIREIQKMVTTMNKSATNLYSLLDNLLQWTRNNQGKISFAPQKINFLNVSRDAVSILRPNLDAKNITINHLAEDDLTVFADTIMLKTILRNLVLNAIKFTGSDGNIDIKAQKTPSGITISVLDNGTGKISPYLLKLFSASHNDSAFGTPEEEGTSLGLLLCREYAEKHGGRMWIEDIKGKGSEFKFTLPAFN